MFDFIESGKLLQYFDTDRIVKIGDKQLTEPIPCHLYVDDKKTVFQQNADQPPTYVYGELYTSVDVPVIALNVKVEKINPVTGKPLATYEGLPSKNITGQSRVKYNIQFKEVAPAEFPRTVDVRVWDAALEKWFDVPGLTMELTTATDIVPKDGFEWGTDGFGTELWKITSNNQPLLVDGTTGIVENVQEGLFYALKAKDYPNHKELTYALTEEPKGTPEPATKQFEVFVWDEGEALWKDTQGGTIEITNNTDLDKTFKTVSGITVGEDEWGGAVMQFDNIGFALGDYDTIYLKEKGGNSACLKVTSFGSPADGSNVSFEIVKESSITGA